MDLLCQLVQDLSNLFSVFPDTGATVFLTVTLHGFPVFIDLKPQCDPESTRKVIYSIPHQRFQPATGVAMQTDAHRHSWGEHGSTDDSVHKQSAPDHLVCIPGHM